MKIWITSNFIKYFDVFVVNADKKLITYKFPHSITSEQLIDKLEEIAGDSEISELTLSGRSTVLFGIEEYFGKKGVEILWQ